MNTDRPRQNPARAIATGRCPDRGASGPRASAASFAALCLLALLAPLAACKSVPEADPILRLSAEESLEQGKALMADEKYFKARDYLIHAYEVEPNSAAGREALLLSADSFYLDGGRSNFIQAEARYRDFLNRFPTSERAAYAQFQIANSLSQRMGRPDRDLSATEEALSAYRDLIRFYPTSEYAAQARDKIRLVEENLAQHELMVGEFYLRYGLPPAAAARFEHLVEAYPSYSEKDKVLYNLGLAYIKLRQTEKAREAFDKLELQFPESPYVAERPEVPEPAPEAAESEAMAEGGQPDGDSEEPRDGSDSTVADGGGGAR